jgi:4-hydroxybenzoate polyprenyltransferase
LFILVVGAVLTARMAAMAFNRIADVSLDLQNPRTAGRDLPTGRISRSTAWGIVILSTVAFVLIATFINRLAGILSPLALAIILGYSYTKRFTALSHFVLGLALGLAPIGAWVAVRSELWVWTPWLLAFAVIAWVAGFDILYSLQDVDFDRARGLHSMIVLLGRERALILVRVLHIAMLAPLIGAGWMMQMPGHYYAMLVVIAGGLLWIHVLIYRGGATNLEGASLGANAIVSFGYLAAVAMGIFL